MTDQERIVEAIEGINNKLLWCAIWTFCIAVDSCSVHKIEIFVPDVEKKNTSSNIERPERGQRLPFTERME